MGRGDGCLLFYFFISAPLIVWGVWWLTTCRMLTGYQGILGPRGGAVSDGDGILQVVRTRFIVGWKSCARGT